MIRTIIVDDELLTGVGIQSLIDGKADVRVCGVFHIPEDAVSYLRENPVDIVITDIEMADMNGLELIQVVREENLADGVIILSCHDDFAYAQEAISKGTDSYLLKHNMSPDGLIREIHKVYRKSIRHETARPPSAKPKRKSTGEEIYVLGVLQLRSPEETAGADGGVEGAMLVNLLENIVGRYDMGTLFAPYNREIFVIFPFHRELSVREREKLLSANISVIRRNIQQLVSGSLIFGVSQPFTSLKETRGKYEEAAAAMELSFYQPETSVFFFPKNAAKFRGFHFSEEGFLEPGGMDIFVQELSGSLRNACLSAVPVQSMQVQLLQAVNRMGYHILQDHRFSEGLIHRWNENAALVAVVSRAKNAHQLAKQLTEAVRNFRAECLEELEADSLRGTLAYIDQHLSEKLILTELAERSCMSVPTFSKRFKERTGMTLVQYVSDRRIRLAKHLLRDKNYSLEQIAEDTGFSNPNYLIRVFKKVTGKTISEYRK